MTENALCYIGVGGTAPYGQASCSRECGLPTLGYVSSYISPMIMTWLSPGVRYIDQMPVPHHPAKQSEATLFFT